MCVPSITGRSRRKEAGGYVFVQWAIIELISFDFIKYFKITNLDFSFKGLLSIFKKAVNCFFAHFGHLVAKMSL